MLTLACALALAPQDDVTVFVRNQEPAVRREVVRASVPFAFGRVRELPHLRAGDAPAACVPLLRWRDGSLALVQAQFELEVAAASEAAVHVRVVPATVREPAPPLPAGELERLAAALRTELLDPWERSWVATLQPDAGSVVATPFVRVQRFTGVHRDPDGRAFLGVVAWLTTFRGDQRAELTLVLDNGASPRLRDPGLGPVRFTSFALRLPPGLTASPRFAAENLLPAPVRGDEGSRQLLLGPSAHLYLGDRTAKAWRFDLHRDGQSPPRALRAWPALADVRRTRAFGLAGGPAPEFATRAANAHARWRAWRERAGFGPFGAFGDEPDAGASGLRRDGPSVLHDLLRWRSDELADAAEGAVLQQTLRPTPGWTPRLPADLAAFRQGLSARAIAQPHGFTALDYEHASVGLLADWYWLTGDPLARDELLRTGPGLVRLLQGVPFPTARGEGGCMQAVAAVARATGDDRFETFLLERFRTLLAPRLGRAPQPFALAQPPHDDAFGPGVPFDAPWQMAMLVHGLHALFQATGAADVADATVQVGEVMAGPGWLAGVGPKCLVSALDAGRYRLPVAHGPLDGTAMLQASAFTLARELALAPATRDLFALRAAAIAQPAVHADPAAAHSDPWLQLWLDRR